MNLQNNEKDSRGSLFSQSITAARRRGLNTQKNISFLPGVRSYSSHANLRLVSLWAPAIATAVKEARKTVNSAHTKGGIMQTPSVIGITGARSLNAQQLAVVRHVATQAAQSGIVYTGCAVGADAAAIAGAGKLARVFAVGTWYGSGFPRQGTPPAVATAQGRGNHITWLAGGPLTLPLVARLARRSLAMVRAVAEAGGSLVAFPAAPRPPRAFGSGPFPSCGSGTWATVGAAALLGVPVFVVFPARPSAVLPVAGTWMQSSLFNTAGWQLAPGQTRAF